MSLAVLQQTYDEVRRLAIAGSVVAPNDFRLKKLVGPLEQVGKQAPVFAKIAGAVTRLLEANERESAEALLELSTLISAVLYTQGVTRVEGEFEPIETFDLAQQHTRTSARMLKPVIDALTTTGSGRVEIIEDALQQGTFRDLRLVGPALGALDDPYAEIAAFIAREVLPLYGRAILPELHKKLDIKGRGGHVHRLMVIARLDPSGARPLIEQALDEGSKEMRIAAIECLGSSPDDLNFLLEQSKTRAKDVRAAALRALCRSTAAEAADALRSAMRNGTIEPAVRAVAESDNPYLSQATIDEAGAQWDALLAGKEKDKAKTSKQVAKLQSVLECLRGRQDQATEEFLLRAFAQREAMDKVSGEPSGRDILEQLTSIMACGPRRVLDSLIDAHASLCAQELAEAFRAGCRVRSPAEVFEMFSSYLNGGLKLRKKSRDEVANKRDAIAGVIAGSLSEARWIAPGGQPSDRSIVDNLDQRWLDVAVKNERLDLVQALARPGHVGANRLLAREFESQLKKSVDPFALSGLLQTMVRVRHPGATDAVVATIGKLGKSPRAYGMYLVARVISELPVEAVPKLEALLPGLPEKTSDQLVGFIDELKNRPQAGAESPASTPE